RRAKAGTGFYAASGQRAAPPGPMPGPTPRGDCMSKFAVFGHPVSHSLSPQIHAAFGRQLGIALQYQAIDATPERFFEMLEAFGVDGGTGANVTLPLKESAFALSATTTARARRARAVNTLPRDRKSTRLH